MALCARRVEHSKCSGRLNNPIWALPATAPAAPLRTLPAHTAAQPLHRQSLRSTDAATVLPRRARSAAAAVDDGRCRRFLDDRTCVSAAVDDGRCRRFLDDRTCCAHDEIPIPDRYMPQRQRIRSRTKKADTVKRRT